MTAVHSGLGVWTPGVYPPGLGITKSGATSMALHTAASTLATVAAGSGPAAPFILAAAAIAELGAAIASMFHGCGSSCVLATHIVDDQWGPAVQAISAAYWHTPAPRPRSFQQSTLQQLEDAFNWLRQACGDPTLGDAGKRCISERVVRGGTAPWCPSADHKGCDAYTTIYDPIANDPDIVDDVDLGISSPIGGLLGASSDGLVLAALGIAAVVVVLLAVSAK